MRKCLSYGAFVTRRGAKPPAMAMWTNIKDFVQSLAGEEDTAADLGEEQLRLASAALLVHATLIDGDVDTRETKTLKRLLESQYGLSAREVTSLISEAKEREHDAVDLYGFTSVLTGRLGQDGRRKIVEMLWEIVMADGVIHEFEANLVWRVAELLGVSARDRIRLRKSVEQRLLKSVWDED